MIKVGIGTDPAEQLPWMKPEERFEHMFIIGGTGSGKTSVLLRIINQEHGHQIIVDPSGDLAQRAKTLRPDAIYVDKNNPISLNPFKRPGLTTSQTTNEVTELIGMGVEVVAGDQTKFTVLMQEILRNAVPYIEDIFEFNRILSHESERKKLPTRYWQEFDARLKGGWYKHKDQVESTRRVSARLSLMTDDEHVSPFFRGPNQFSLDRSYIFNLGGFDDVATTFLGAMITTQLKTYYILRTEIGGPEIYAYIDEYHLFLNEKFERFLTESRKFNISMTLSGHSFAQVTQKMRTIILGSCTTKLMLDCAYEDAKHILTDVQYQGRYEFKKWHGLLTINKEIIHMEMYPPLEVERYVPPNVPPEKVQTFLKDGWIDV